MVTRQRLTVDEYLAIPEPDEPPYLEYVRGEVVEKPVPNVEHGKMVVRSLRKLGDWSDLNGGEIGTEGRARFADPDDPRFLLPDISFYRRGAVYRDGQLYRAPTLSIE